MRCAIEHKQPDHVPVEFAARVEVFEKLQRYWHLETAEQLLEKLQSDLRYVAPVFKLENDPLCYADPTIEVTDDGIYKDIWGVGFKLEQTEHGQYLELAWNPLKELGSLDELETYAWPEADWWDYSTIKEQALLNSKYWIWAHSRGIFEISWFMRGMDNFLMDMASRPDWAGAVMDRVQHYLMERARRVLEAGNGSIDMMEYNDDVGGQGGLLISPQMWRTYIKPRMAEFIRMCRQYDVKIRYHCCGGIRPIIPELIEIGVDVLNPVQPLAVGMELESLKRDFGDRITFDGGIDTQNLLPFANSEQVRSHTQKLIEVLGRNGGYIMQPSHVLQDDVPIENILSMYETALQKRF